MNQENPNLRLQAYVDGELTPDERESLDRKVEADERYQAELREHPNGASCAPVRVCSTLGTSGVAGSKSSTPSAAAPRAKTFGVSTPTPTPT